MESSGVSGGIKTILRKRKTESQRYFERFFAEKEIPDELFSLTDLTGTVHLVDTDVIKEQILNCGPDEQKQLMHAFTVADFKNVPMVRLFRDLGQAMVDQFSRT